MRSLEYVCAATGESVSFEGPVYGETVPALRGHSWSYELGGRSVAGISMPAREAQVTVKVVDHASLDRLRMLADADMAAGSPGTLVADGQWRTDAFIAKSDIQSVTPTIVETSLTFLLPDPWWRRRISHVFTRRTSADSAWLDLPADLPADLSGMAAVRTLDNPEPHAMPAVIRVYGPCVNPYLLIGDNRYQVDCTVPSGGRLEIDGASSVKTVTLIDAQGRHANMFAAAHRGDGLGSGQYIFEPIAAGGNLVTWQNDFDFDVELVVERSEPPWA